MNAEISCGHEFICRYADSYSREICRALVWRIVDADPGYDLYGAWSQLVSIYRLAEKNRSVEVRLLGQLEPFLAHLIRARWFTRAGARGNERTEDPLDAVKRQLGIQAACSSAPSSTSSSPAAGAAYGTVAGTGAGGPTPEELINELTLKFKNLESAWLGLLQRDFANALHAVMKEVREKGNMMDDKERKYLSVPSPFRDSLGKLRRRHPRPTNVCDVACWFGWETERKQDFNNPQGLPTQLDVEALCPMHPTAKTWLLKLAQGKCCILCDTWRHDFQHCPCEAAVKALQPQPLAGGAEGGPRRPPRPPVVMSYGEAIAKLARYDIQMPIEAGMVLDRIVSLINKELPYEDVMQAFDVVRGFPSGVEDRRALWIHASYNLLPSHTVFKKPSDSISSPAMKKAAAFLTANRRYNELDLLERAVDHLDDIYRKNSLPKRVMKDIDEIKDNHSFLFCFSDSTFEPGRFSADQCCQCIAEEKALRPYFNVLCKNCLEPFHTAEHCSVKEPWDYQCARSVLTVHGLLEMRYPDEASKIDDAKRSVDESDMFSRKEHIKATIDLAVAMIFERKVFYCFRCKIFGHSTKKCEVTVLDNLSTLTRLTQIEVKLRPELLSDVINDERCSERDKKKLQDCYNYLVGDKLQFAYPREYDQAIVTLMRYRVDPSAARYCPEAVEKFLLATNQLHLLMSVRTCQEAKFPDLCFLCVGGRHTTVECRKVHDDEKNFLLELQDQQIPLQAFAVSTLCPEHPLNVQRKFHTFVTKSTRFPTGRTSVIKTLHQYCDDYGPQGKKREDWLNGQRDAVERRTSSRPDLPTTTQMALSLIATESQCPLSNFGADSFSQRVQVAEGDQHTFVADDDSNAADAGGDAAEEASHTRHAEDLPQKKKGKGKRPRDDDIAERDARDESVEEDYMDTLRSKHQQELQRDEEPRVPETEAIRYDDLVGLMNDDDER